MARVDSDVRVGIKEKAKRAHRSLNNYVNCLFLRDLGRKVDDDYEEENEETEPDADALCAMRGLSN